MSRRAAREVVLQTLFQMDVGLTKAEKAFEFALETTPLDEKTRQYAQKIVEQAMKDWNTSGEMIAGVSVDWEVERLNRVDRSLIRLAIAEIALGVKDAPTSVIINEVIEMAKIYSTEESSRFINGILGQLARTQDWR